MDPVDAARSIELASDITSLELLAAFIEAFGEEHGLDAGLVMHLNLALDELVTHALTHGGSKAPIEVILSIGGERVRAEIRDRGKPFDPRKAPAPDLDSPIEERRIGGLGIHMVKKMMDSVDYEWTEGQNRVRLEKRFGSDAAGGRPRSGE